MKKIVSFIIVAAGFVFLAEGGSIVSEDVMISVEIVLISDILFAGISWINSHRPSLEVRISCYMVGFLAGFMYLIGVYGMFRYNVGVASIMFPLTFFLLPTNQTIFYDSMYRIVLSGVIGVLCFLLGWALFSTTDLDIAVFIRGTNAIGSFIMLLFALAITLAMKINHPPKSWLTIPA